MKKRKIWIPVLVLLVLAVGAGGWFYYKEYFAPKPLRAMYLPTEDGGHLMVDQDTGAVFTVDIPETILDKDGKKITWQELNAGDILNIYGDGIMLESYPGQYPGVTKIKVVKEGDPSDTEKYQELLEQYAPRAVAF